MKKEWIQMIEGRSGWQTPQERSAEQRKQADDVLLSLHRKTGGYHVTVPEPCPEKLRKVLGTHNTKAAAFEKRLAAWADRYCSLPLVEADLSTDMAKLIASRRAALEGQFEVFRGYLAMVKNAIELRPAIAETLEANWQAAMAEHEKVVTRTMKALKTAGIGKGKSDVFLRAQANQSGDVLESRNRVAAAHKHHSSFTSDRRYLSAVAILESLCRLAMAEVVA